ncbi:hypothetical protein TSAR_013080 [Trichomalopsis sarcophagae]|uniref:RNA-directed DNA polymerase n=1 Tax=Trichomalopsis sarcophagae TaxID=543379 RepID=A0A232FNC8_9HYME|nr:hypothetical protein TSAR_013080 [Trichomalopsis sarcophagae]
MRNPNRRFARWALEVQAYDYDIVHRKGSLNHIPDALSRMYEDEESDETPISSIQPNSLSCKDDWYDTLIAQVLEKPTVYPYYKVVAGQLYHHRVDSTLEDIIDDQDAWKMDLRADKVSLVLQESHCEPTAGHLGRRKTYDRIARYYYWKNTYRDVSNFVRVCAVCQQSVQGINAKLAPKYMGPFKITARLGQDAYRLENSAGEVFEKIHVVDLKRYLDGEKSPTDEDLQEEATSENAQSNDHVVNVDAPRKSGRPRKTRVVDARLQLESRARRKLAAHRRWALLP